MAGDGAEVIETIESKEIKTGKFGVATTPVAQQSAISDPSSDTAANNAAIDSILVVLRNYGLIATS